MAAARGASDMFYGDSDAGSQVADSESEDENPFLDIPAHRAGPNVPTMRAGGGNGGGGHCSTAQAPPAVVAAATTTFTQGPFQAFPPMEYAAAGLPTITGSGSTRCGNILNNRGGVLERTDTDVTMSEVETEGETENEDSGSEGGGGGEGGGARRGEPPARAATKADWPNNSEEDWLNLIEHQLKNAKAGRPDAHAMRQVLRKAGFVPEFLRKDVWRLLILGRVDAAAADGTGAGDVLALDVAILSTELNLENQRVVRVDVERTRPALEQFKRPRVKNMLARVLTHHCKTHGLGYKQGMHEVLAPFVALSDPELPTSDISLCYSAFMKRFLPYAFNKDEEFLSLQICFRLFRLLLLYHHPRLCRFLDQYQLQPELYATPWFMTLFSNSLDLPRLYEVWDFYLYWGDPALHHFVVLAFVIGNAEVILKAEEANLPETMCRLTEGMRSIEELRALMRTAKDLMLNTPKSFRKILRSALYANLSQSQMNLVLNTLQVSSCIPVSAEEITSYILHKNPHRQLDQDSDDEDEEADDVASGRRSGSSSGNQFLASRTRSGGWGGGGGGLADGRGKASQSPQRRAERAAMRSLRGHRQYIILDCRPREEFDSCRLAPALHLDPELLMSPEKLDAKLKEFMPLQGMAHFCLVGSGDDTGAGSVRHRKNTAMSDLSGEAMGLRTVSISKTDSPGASGPAGDAGSNADHRGGDTGGLNKPDGGLGRDRDRDRDHREKEGGFFGGVSRALLRGYGHAVGREGEEEVGREEDVQVARFVLMLLQYNFPYITHVRGDMAACLEELSAQALDEKGNQHVASADFQETLHGALIGADSDRVREQLMHCSPEKKTEGLFSGLSKWSKDKADSRSGPANGAAGNKATFRADATSSARKNADAAAAAAAAAVAAATAAAAARGRGGLGRREANDLYVMVKPQDEKALETKTSKRRLFGGVMDRFEKPDNARAGRGPVESFADARPQWLSPGRSRASKSDATAEAAATASDSVSGARAGAGTEAEAGAGAGTGAGAGAGAGAAPDGVDGAGKPTATWTKPGRNKDTPDRFSRFLGKMLGVKDDALPDRPIDGQEPVIGGYRDDEQAEAARRLRSPTDDASRGGAEEAAAASAAGEVEQPTEPTTSLASSGGARVGVGSAAAATATATAAAADATTTATPRATAVCSAVSTATATAMADAMPVAVAVAVPLADEAASRADPSRPARRPSRSGRTLRTSGSTRSSRETVRAGGGEAVSIAGWVAREERESGGLVRVFSAQRVVDGNVKKKCRLAVSRKNMTQFDDIEDDDRATGGARGVIAEHRGLRHLSRITSRKKHADLIVFHFKSRSGSGASSTASAASAASVSASAASSSSSRRSRTSRTGSSSDITAQPDVLFYFMKEHADCLRMVKENYRKVTQGSRVDSSSTLGGTTASAAAASGASAALDDPERRPARQAARAAAGAAAGAAGIMVGAAAGMAVGAAAGVAVGAAFLAGHRKGSHEENKSRSASPSSRARRRGGSEGAEGAGGGGGGGGAKDERRSSGGWIPIDAPAAAAAGEERRRSDHGVGRRPSSAGGGGGSSGSRRTSLSNTTGSMGRGARGRSGRGASKAGDAEAPGWLGRR
eukprot:g16180.t1